MAKRHATGRTAGHEKTSATARPLQFPFQFAEAQSIARVKGAASDHGKGHRTCVDAAPLSFLGAIASAVVKAGSGSVRYEGIKGFSCRFCLWSRLFSPMTSCGSRR